MAHVGLCSRRDAERWIEAGRVSVNGTLVTTPAFTVTDADEIAVDGQLIAEKPEPRIWLYHKPVGVVTTHKDPDGRLTVFDSLPKNMPRVISVGRLDLNSEGLLLLTNDGELARQLELPSSGHTRTYRVRVRGAIDDKMLYAIRKGVTVEGVHYAPAEVTIEGGKGANQWMVMTLTEGKNREIRRIFEHFGCQVSRLVRLSYGPYMLGDLERGQVKEVPVKKLPAKKSPQS